MIESKKWENENSRKGVCWECQERYPKCHSKCERYQKEREEWSKANKALTEEKMITKMYGKRDRRKQPCMRRY